MAKKQNNLTAPAEAPGHASLEAVEDWVFENKAAHLDCRVKGHNMAYPHVTENENGTFTQTERCRRCGTKRHELVDVEGYTLWTKMSDYPEGYLLPKGTGRIDQAGRAVLRRRRINAIIEKRAGRR